MAFLDQFINTGVNQANTSITQVRTSTSQKLTKLITGALPGTNKIPGAAGALLGREVTKRVGDGVNQVLSALDISTVTKAITANPKIYNNGAAAAKGIWTQVENGNTDVKNIVAGSLEPLTLLKYTDMQIQAGDNKGAEFADPKAADMSGKRYSPYAMDLFRLAPKHKFLFVCEFVFNGNYAEVGQGKTHKNEFALVIKDFEKPKIKSEYDTVNYYNFRTPIVKKTTHDPLVIKFLDDRQNVSMKFIHEYLKATHPITAVGPESADFYEDNGMNWNSPMNSSSTAVLEDDLRTIIKEIKVYHLYDFGAKMNVYHFTNPKVIEMNLDNWNMHESDGSEITTVFGYDGLFIELEVPINQAENEVLGTLSNSGHYHLEPLQVEESQITVQPSKRVDARGIDPATAQSAAIGSAQAAISDVQRRAAAIRENADDWVRQQERANEVNPPPIDTNDPDW